jgi:predicted metal-dependent hydrolase
MTSKGVGVSTPSIGVETLVLSNNNGTTPKGIHFDKVPAPEIKIVKKDVKHINLKVKPNGEVILTAPTDSNERDIEYVLKKRADWIDKKIAFFDAHRDVSEKEYVSGENFCYLGRNYRLKVIECRDLEGVKLQRGYLQVFVKNTANVERKKKLLRAWYSEKAQIHFMKAIEKYKPIVKQEIETVRIREMKTRWGSCNPSKGYININLKLIEKSTECIEYVVFHELAHLVHADHSVKFYNYLNLFMPDWKKRKERLECVS